MTHVPRPIRRRAAKLALILRGAAALASAALLGLCLPTGASAAKRPAEDTVTLNFVNADLEAVVRAVGQFTGRSFVIDPRVKGTLTLATERPVTRRQAFEELLSALRLQGFTMVEPAEAGGVTRVVLEADAKLQGGRVLEGGTPAPRGDQVLTQVFRLQYESASNIVPVLRPLIAPNNTITAYPANNTLVVTDYADNLRRLARIIEAVDSPAGTEVEVVPLRHGLASEIAALVGRVLDDAGRGGATADPGQRVQVQAETRSNALILRAASRARLEQARGLIAHFDQPNATPGNINVIYLRNAQAARLAPLLRAVLAGDPGFVAQAGSSTSLSGGSGGSMAGSSGTGSGLGSGFGGSSTSGLSGTANTTTPASPASGAGAASSSGGGDRGLAGMIQADPATNSLIVSAPEPLYRNIRAIVDKLDARPAQVLIESLVVELSGDTASEFGVQWQSLTGLNGSSPAVIGGTNFGSGSQNIISGAENLANLGPGLNIGVVKGSVNIPGVGTITNIGLLARALSTRANANILSRPNLLTLDNEEGRFLVGQNVPFVTGSYASTGATTTASAATVNPFQTYERHDVGLQLRVKPQISEGGSVRLSIYIEDSSVAPASSGTNLVLNKRSFETSTFVEDGNFVVISGMIQDQTTENQYKVPLLGDVPLLGALFRYDTREHVKTQTMVFLRPHVIRDEASSHSISLERYEYIRGELAAAQPARHLILEDARLPDLPPLEGTTPGGAAAPPAATIRVAAAAGAQAIEAVNARLRGTGLQVHAGVAPDGSGVALLNPPAMGLEAAMAVLQGLGFEPQALPPVPAPASPPASPPAPAPAPVPAQPASR